MKVFISLKVAYEYELDSLQINDICMKYQIPSMVSIKFPSFVEICATWWSIDDNLFENKYGVYKCTEI
jgi:hypothetical protein